MATRPTTKRCSHCGDEKELELFHKHPRSPDGRQHLCIECYNRYRRERYRQLKGKEPPKTAVCAKCGKRRRAKFFSKGCRASGLSMYCKICTNKQQTDKRKEPKGRANHMVWQAKARSKRNGLHFNMTPDRVREVIEAGHCEATGIKFDLHDPRGPYSPSLDRKDPAKGYTEENVQVVITAFNLAKNRWPEEQLIEILEAYKKCKSKGS